MFDEEYMAIEAEIVEPTEGDLISGYAIPAQLLNETAYNCLFNCSNATDTVVKPSSEVFSPTMLMVIAIAVPILFGLIVIVGLIGNTLVVIVVLCNPLMRSTTNVLIINLAMADLLFIMFCVPFTAFDYSLPYWPFGDAWCRVVQYLIMVCAYTSIYTLVLMSFDRFLAVVHPIPSMSIRTVRNAFIAIGILWAVILLACIPALMSHGEVVWDVGGETQYSACMFLGKEGYNQVAFQICFFLSSYIIPLGIIFVLYMLMLKRLWLGVAPGGRMSAESLKSKKRVTRMVVIVVVIFAVCWCPIHIVLVLRSVDSYQMDTFKLAVQILAQTMAYMNSCVNPILYAFLSDNFRKAFHKVIACNQRQDALPSKTTQTTQENRTERETTLNNGTNSRPNANNSANDIL